MNQELLLQASLLEKESQQIQQNLQLIDREVIELEQLTANLKNLAETKQKEILSGIGKGLYLKTNLLEKDLFVQVGSGIIVKKTPQEASKILESQIKALIEARTQILSQLSINNQKLNEIITEIQKEAKNQSQ